REGVDVKTTLDMLAQYDFRSLIPRVKAALEGKVQGGAKIKASGVHEFSAENSLSSPSVNGESPLQPTFLSAPANVPEEEFKKIALAVWVLDSAITEPGIEDIYRIGKSDDFEEAKKNILAEIKEKKLEFVYE